MAKGNAFAGTGAFSSGKEKQADQFLDVEKAGKFLIGAYYSKRIRMEFQDAIHPTRKTIRRAQAEAFDDWFEKNGRSRFLVDALEKEQEERLNKKNRVRE